MPRIVVDGIAVEIVRKKIKHIRLTVYPPDGRVCLSAPLFVDGASVLSAISMRLPWIRRQQERCRTQNKGALALKYVTGETVEMGGQSYLLNVIEHEGPATVTLRVMEGGCSSHLPPSTAGATGRASAAASRLSPPDQGVRALAEGEGGECVVPSAAGGKGVIDLYVRPRSDATQRAAVLAAWTKESLKAQIPPLLLKWQPVIGVNVTAWGVRAMRTRWGSCNTVRGRIWLSSELARKPQHLLEYVVVHELVHLLERGHGVAFKNHMDRFLPGWRRLRRELNHPAA